jgi:hypothetical protein
MLRRLGATSAKKRSASISDLFLADVLALFIDHALKVETPRHSRKKSGLVFGPETLQLQGLVSCFVSCRLHQMELQYSFCRDKGA